MLNITNKLCLEVNIELATLFMAREHSTSTKYWYERLVKTDKYQKIP